MIALDNNNRNIGTDSDQKMDVDSQNTQNMSYNDKEF